MALPIAQGLPPITHLTLSGQGAPSGPVAIPQPIGSDYANWHALINGLQPYGRVSRSLAMQVPAVKRARDLICTTLGQLPLHSINAQNVEIPRALLDQPESARARARVVTLTRTYEDLLFDGFSLWVVATRDNATKFPTSVEHIPYDQWTQDADGTVRVGGNDVNWSDCIIFESPNEPLCVAGAGTIRAAALLADMASLYTSSPEAREYFQLREGSNKTLTGDQIQKIIDQWEEGRKSRATGYIPYDLVLNHVQRQTAEEMQLIEARTFVATEVARLCSIDPEDMSVSITSRTYANTTDRRRALIDFTLSPYMSAVEQRLSMTDVTPRGQQVKVNLDAFLRGSTLERLAAYKQYLDMKIMTIEQVCALEGIPLPNATDNENVTPPTEEPLA